jgi:hypothetical protein
MLSREFNRKLVVVAEVDVVVVVEEVVVEAVVGVVLLKEEIVNYEPKFIDTSVFWNCC